MKKGWETKKLSEVCLIKTGEKDVNQGNPTGKYPFFTCARRHTFSDTFSFDTEALLIAGNGDVGNVSYYNGKFEAYQRTYILYNFDYILPRYLFLILDGTLKSSMSNQKLGNTMPYIKLGMLKEFKIPLPPLLEQKQIVSILDKAFEAIDKAKDNAEQNLKNAQELFESSLHGMFEDKGEDWVEKRLGDVLVFPPKNGWSPPAKYHSNIGVPVLTLSAVTGFIFNKASVKFTSAPVKRDSSYWLNEGDLLITRSNTPELVGHVAICEGLNDMTIYPDLMMKINPKEILILTRFLYYQLRSPKLREIIKTSAHGANPTMKKINKQDVQNFNISYPSLQEQKQIVTKLDNLSAETNKLELIYQKKIDDLEELKKSILQKAFSGEL
jgi:type I restriction enzyme S subunit